MCSRYHARRINMLHGFYVSGSPEPYWCLFLGQPDFPGQQIVYPVCQPFLNMFNDVTQPFFWFHIVQAAGAGQRVQHRRVFTVTPRKAFSAMLLSISPRPLRQYTFSAFHCFSRYGTPLPYPGDATAFSSGSVSGRTTTASVVRSGLFLPVILWFCPDGK